MRAFWRSSDSDVLDLFVPPLETRSFRWRNRFVNAGINSKRSSVLAVWEEILTNTFWPVSICLLPGLLTTLVCAHDEKKARLKSKIKDVKMLCIKKVWDLAAIGQLPTFYD